MTEYEHANLLAGVLQNEISLRIQNGFAIRAIKVSPDFYLKLSLIELEQKKNKKSGTYDLSEKKIFGYPCIVDENLQYGILYGFVIA